MVDLAYQALYSWQPLVLPAVYGTHAHGYKAEDPARPEGCYHALVLAPDPLRTRPVFILHVERLQYIINELGVTTTIPDVLPPALRVVLDAKMQLCPRDIILAVMVEWAMMVNTPVFVVEAMQVGQIKGVLGDSLGSIRA